MFLNFYQETKWKTKNPIWRAGSYFENDIAEMKSDRFLPIYTSIVLLKFGVDIKSQNNLESQSGNKTKQNGSQVAI